MKLFPCWSSIMVSSFGYGEPIVSSSRGESNFNQLKSRLFKQDVMPVRVDSFIEKILPYYKGDNLLHQGTLQDQNNKNNVNDDNTSQNSPSHESNFSENGYLSDLVRNQNSRPNCVMCHDENYPISFIIKLSYTVVRYVKKQYIYLAT